MRTNIALPAQNVPIQMPDGSINPIWYEKLRTIEAFLNLFGYIEFPSLPSGAHRPPPYAPPTYPNLSVTITAGQYLRWDDTNKIIYPG
jgi:hypothetical protein